MRVFAISDVHLSLGVENKSMDVFGTGWARHIQRLQEGWRDTVAPGDLVLLAGDISWAMYRQDAREDLFFLHTLPGTKVLLRGNHDFWWSGYSKVLSMLPPSLKAVQNNALRLGDICICGTRGWMNDPIEKKVLLRECGRLRMSLEEGKKSGKEPLVFLHYPPVFGGGECYEILDVLLEYGIRQVYYGHIHGYSSGYAINGIRNGIDFRLISCDFVQFNPVKIM